MMTGIHYFLIISRKIESRELTKYIGLELSSKIAKANKNNDKCPNNIYFSDYSSILVSGKLSNHREGFVDVGEIHNFTDRQLTAKYWYAGKVKEEFLKFILSCRENARKGKRYLNADKFWEI